MFRETLLPSAPLCNPRIHIRRCNSACTRRCTGRLPVILRRRHPRWADGWTVRAAPERRAPLSRRRTGSPRNAWASTHSYAYLHTYIHTYTRTHDSFSDEKGVPLENSQEEVLWVNWGASLEHPLRVEKKEVNDDECLCLKLEYFTAVLILAILPNFFDKSLKLTVNHKVW